MVGLCIQHDEPETILCRGGLGGTVCGLEIRSSGRNEVVEAWFSDSSVVDVLALGRSDSASWDHTQRHTQACQLIHIGCSMRTQCVFQLLMVRDGSWSFCLMFTTLRARICVPPSHFFECVFFWFYLLSFFCTSCTITILNKINKKSISNRNW